MKFFRTLVAFALLTSPALFAQPWTPPAGQGSTWISAQTLRTDAHILNSGTRAHDIEIRANTLTLGVDYGITDRLAVSLSVPYVSSRLKAGTPHGSTVDDFRTHETLTDLSFELRYKAVDSGVVFTPTLAVSIPVRDYETLGHNSAGRGLNEYAAGFEVGHNAVAISPYLFVSGRYAYTYVERIVPDITVDRSNADLQLAYFVTPRLSLRAASIWQKTYGGLTFPISPEDAAEHGHHHDQLSMTNFWRGAGAIGYAVSPSLDVFGSWSTVIEGENTHAFRAWSVGLAWNFDGSRLRQRSDKSVAPRPQVEESTLR